MSTGLYAITTSATSTTTFRFYNTVTATVDWRWISLSPSVDLPYSKIVEDDDPFPLIPDEEEV